MTCMLYLHIPFCRSVCRYCDFYSESGANDARVNRYVTALAGEWSMRKSGIQSVSSIFIGGGTPSVLTLEQWKRLVDSLFVMVPRAAGAEWTIECNPDSFTEDKARVWLDAGVNRITFGVQSMVPRELRTLGRAHSCETVEKVLSSKVLRCFGFVGVDIMYAIPGQTIASLAHTLHTITSYDVVKHLSIYELSIAPETPFGRHAQILPLPDLDTVAEMDGFITDFTAARGFVRYEVSNYAQDGNVCKHNCGYWNHTPYVGLGASAHSFVKNRRFWNVNSLDEYVRLVQNGNLPIERGEDLDSEMLSREMLFLGLRNTNGINEDLYCRVVGRLFAAGDRKQMLDRFIKDNYLVYEKPFWRPTVKGLQCADYLARELF